MKKVKNLANHSIYIRLFFLFKSFLFTLRCFLYLNNKLLTFPMKNTYTNMSLILLTNNKFCDKIQAHQQGLQHWAFSVFIFNKNNQLLLQKRSSRKYHSPNLWTNTCCSHFSSLDEFNNKEDTIKKRLLFELDFDFKDKLFLFDTFEYKADVGENLIENEVDCIFIGKQTGEFDLTKAKDKLNKEEVSDIKFEDIFTIKTDAERNPNTYTEWFKMIVSKEDFIAKIGDFLDKTN